MLTRFLACTFLALLPSLAHAQVFNCSVRVEKQITGSDVGFLDDLGTLIERYYNDRAWNNDRFEPIERIVCNIQIQFTAAVSQTRFRANYSISTRRPIYGTTGASTVVTLADQNWEFDYAPGGQLTFDPRRFDALTTLLDYYAYLALGYDYDTFSRLGGQKYFEQARELVQVAQAASQWQPTNSAKDRVTLITQLLDPRFQPLRVAYYDLHYGALDRFVDNPETARQAVLKSLQNVRTLFDEVSKQYALELLFTSKGGEIVDMMEKSPERAQAYELLIAMDPGRPTTYNRLLN